MAGERRVLSQYSKRTPRTTGAFSGHRVIPVVVVVGFVVLAGIGLVYWSQPAQQPRIQAVEVNIAPPVANPRAWTVLAANVSGHGAFSHIAKLPGSYSMVFNNSISPFSPKTVTLNWTDPNGVSRPQTFTVDPGGLYNLTVQMKLNQAISGNFSVSGNPGNEIGFSLTARACTDHVSFSFSLVNGGASGYARVQLLVDGRALWTNRYFVAQGGQVPGSGYVTLLDCNPHNTSIEIASQERA